MSPTARCFSGGQRPLHAFSVSLAAPHLLDRTSWMPAHCAQRCRDTLAPGTAQGHPRMGGRDCSWQACVVFRGASQTDTQVQRQPRATARRIGCEGVPRWSQRSAHHGHRERPDLRVVDDGRHHHHVDMGSVQRRVTPWTPFPLTVDQGIDLAPVRGPGSHRGGPVANGGEGQEGSLEQDCPLRPAPRQAAAVRVCSSSAVVSRVCAWVRRGSLAGVGPQGRRGQGVTLWDS